MDHLFWMKQGIKTSQSGLILGIINFTEMGGEKKTKEVEASFNSRNIVVQLNFNFK